MRYEKEAQDYFEELREHRRALHRIPELGNQEWETSRYIMEHLQKLAPDSLEVFLETGIRCVFKGQTVAPAVAFRADMDALPVQEPEGCPFRSIHEGRMHACGHDGHMAILLTLAHFLADRRELLFSDVVLVFQPAEETTGGAKRMIDAGVFDSPVVEEVYGLHMMPDVPIGKVAVCPGPIMASTCEINIHLEGRSSHGAAPHQGNDAILAAGTFLTMLQSIVSRRIDPAERAVVTIGKLTAGRSRNIVADEARMEGIIRTYSDAVFLQIESLIKEQLKALEPAFGVRGTLERGVYYPCTNNHPDAAYKAQVVLQDRYVPAVPRMTAEDFSYYLLEAPGAFMFLGCMDEEHKSPLHSESFGFDEQALVYGLAAFANLARIEE